MHSSPATVGKIVDTSPGSNFYWYYYPSLMVNSQNDIAIGFNGSRPSEYIGAFYWGRRASGATVSRPVLMQAGRDYFHFSTASPRWGDYSATSLDPIDGLTFVTFQEYAETEGTTFETSLWRNWITFIKPIP